MQYYGSSRWHQATIVLEDNDGRMVEIVTQLPDVDVQYYSADDSTTYEISGKWDVVSETRPLDRDRDRGVQDRQVDGDHYSKRKVQPWDILDAYPEMDPLTFIVLRYLLRWPDKNGVVDLKKARHTLDRLIENQEKSGTM